MHGRNLQKRHSGHRLLDKKVQLFDGLNIIPAEKEKIYRTYLINFIRLIRTRDFCSSSNLSKTSTNQARIETNSKEQPPNLFSGKLTFPSTKPQPISIEISQLRVEHPYSLHPEILKDELLQTFKTSPESQQTKIVNQSNF